MENMVSNPLVSVLIPTFNRGKELSQTLQSVIDNNFPNLEIIVYDNKSTDNTKSIIDRFSNISNDLKYYCQEKNLGPLENWKSAINVASGKYIHWLWSDDWVENDFYITMTNKLEKDSSNVVFCSVKTVNIEDNWEKITYTYKDSTYNADNFLKQYITGFKYPLSPAACLLKIEDCKTILNNFYVSDTKNIKVNKYGTGYDALMIMESIYNAKRISVLKDQLINFRNHKKSISVAESGLGNQTRYAHSRLVWAKNKNFGLWFSRYDLLRLLYFKKYNELYHAIFE